MPPPPLTRECSRPCCPTSVKSSATRPVAAMPLAGRRRRPWTRRASRLRRLFKPRRRGRLFLPAAPRSPTTWRSKVSRKLTGTRAIISLPAAPSTGRSWIAARPWSGGDSESYLGVDRYGTVRLDQLREAVTDKTVLISVMAANNEIGTVQPNREIGQLAKEKGVVYHCDATQGVGKIPMSVEEMGIDLLSLSGHKIYGPKGVGALYVRSKRPKVRVSPIIDGGGHERGMRSGTLNVPGIVGLGKA